MTSECRLPDQDGRDVDTEAVVQRLRNTLGYVESRVPDCMMCKVHLASLAKVIRGAIRDVEKVGSRRKKWKERAENP